MIHEDRVRSRRENSDGETHILDGSRKKFLNFQKKEERMGKSNRWHNSKSPWHIKIERLTTGVGEHPQGHTAALAVVLARALGQLPAPCPCKIQSCSLSSTRRTTFFFPPSAKHFCKAITSAGRDLITSDAKRVQSCGLPYKLVLFDNQPRQEGLGILCVQGPCQHEILTT